MIKEINELLASEEGKLEINKLFYLWRWKLHASDDALGREEEHLSLCWIADSKAVRIDSRDPKRIMKDVSEAMKKMLDEFKADSIAELDDGRLSRNIRTYPATIGKVEITENDPKTFPELVEKSGKKISWLSEYLEIPYRTVQDWKLGNRSCPAYTFNMIVKTLKSDGII